MRTLPGCNPKPEKLLSSIIHIASKPGDVVLDSFAGSGTTGAVAHKMGRRWIMIELGEHIHSQEIRRLRKVIDGNDAEESQKPRNGRVAVASAIFGSHLRF